ncbi:hypothetical protein ACIQGZ_02000 [Streptomyces sp. NPDC092296]
MAAKMGGGLMWLRLWTADAFHLVLLTAATFLFAAVAIEHG